ncbi:MAG: cardiolipin synthase [Acidobacteriota bacterium]
MLANWTTWAGWWVAVGLPLLHVFGALSAIDAVMKARTPQGASAWALALVLMPTLALPLYWVFGRSHFEDYVEALRVFDDEVEKNLDQIQQALSPWAVPPEAADDPRTETELRGFAQLARLPVLKGNALRLLVDGEATFESLFETIDGAEEYLLVQFYIVHDDQVGRAFKARLRAAAERGVRVYFLYDEVGSHALPGAFLRELRDAGAQVSAFSGERSWLGRFRLNFRNHRKIVVADGRVGLVGGLNVGDEYLGHDPRLSPWRDTHLRVEGPAVVGLQYSFVRDWYYGQGHAPAVSWDLQVSERDQHALILASGPADRLETCGLLYAQAIDAAEERIWIASPYFVPDGRILGALQTAALRGVEVRILMPRNSDSLLFKWVPYVSLSEIERVGVEVYLYDEGFMHQKVVLVDHAYAGVGSANFDNRSFRLNFEVTCLAHDETFCREVEEMLEADFERSTRVTEKDLLEKSFWFRLAAQGTRLLAPIL